MKLDVLYEYVEILNICGVRYGVSLDKKDLKLGLVLEQISKEIDLCLHYQLNTKKIW